VALLRDVIVAGHYDLHQLVGKRYAGIQCVLLGLSDQIDFRYCWWDAGNYSGNKLTAYDAYIVTIVPAVNYLAMFLFYLIWKAHFYSTISHQEGDNSNVKPEKFCLEIEGLEETYINEEELERFFSSFGPVYEISLVRRYKNKLSYFEELDEL
jgi:hypothetical protein